MWSSRKSKNARPEAEYEELLLNQVTVKDHLPKGAVRLSENEIVELQLEKMRTWEPKSEVWPLCYGPLIMSTFASFSGIYLNDHFRKHLKLKSYAKIATILPIVGFPFMVTFVLHQVKVTNDLLVLKTPCAVCVEIRAVSLQLLSGFIYPIIMAPLAAFSFAYSYKTYAIPDLRTNYKEVYQLLRKITLKASPQIAFIITGQALLAAGMTYLEAKSAIKMLDQLQS